MKKFLLTAMLGAMAIGAFAATEEFTWSYCSGKMNLGALGTASAEPYKVAMLFDKGAYAGMKIVKIDAYINADKDALANISNTSVFMTSNLNSNNFLRNKPVEATPCTFQGEEVSVLSYTLDEPYVITGDPIFIGYNLTVTEIPASNNTAQKYPVLLDKNVQEEGAFYINTPSLTEGSWEGDRYTSGAATIVVTIEREAYDWGLAVGLPSVSYAEAGKDFSVMASVSNPSSNPVSTIGYKYSIDGGTAVEKSLTLDSPLNPSVDKIYEVLFPIDAVENAGEYELSLELTTLDGQPNEATGGNVAKGELDVFPFMPKHMPLVEEYTALACGFCPRGYVAMEYIGEEYPDDAVVICYHLEFNGNRDPMTVTGAAPVNTTNYPTASIDRLSVIDPYYGDYVNKGDRDLGIVADMFERASVISIADIQVKNVEVSLPDSVINFSTDITFMKGVKADQYRVGYVLSCNRLYDPMWKQVNYFSRDPEFANTPLISQFYALPGSVYGLTFNDVAINASAMRGIRESIGETGAGGIATHTYSFDVKDVLNIYGASLNKYVRLDEMWINAFVIESNTGRVINATKYPVSNVYDAVEAIRAEQPEGEPIYYDLQGRRVVNPDKGIYIVNGKKVVL